MRSHIVPISSLVLSLTVVVTTPASGESASDPWTPATLPACDVSGGSPPVSTVVAGPRPRRTSASLDDRGLDATPEVSPQVSFEPRTQTAFEASRGRDGSVRLLARAGQLRMRKVVEPHGRVTIELAAGRQSIRFQVTADGIEVTGRGRTLHLDPRTATDEDYTRVRLVLARSKPVRLMRRMAARLEAVDDDRPEAIGVLLGDAFVGMLDGDIGAPGRLARRMARKHAAGLRQAGLSANCFVKYEREVVDAWSDLEACYDSVSVLFYRMCEARWFLWVEASWFSFLSCSWGF